MVKKKFDERKLASFFLRISLAVVFLYAGIGSLLNPLSWLGFIPVWLRNIIPPNIFLPIHAVLDIIIGLWLITGRKQFYASLIASLTLFSIVIFNIGVLDVIFRDIAILFSAVALMILHFKEMNLK